MALTYGWRNHASTGNAASSSAEIPWAEHVSPLDKAVADAHRVFKLGFIDPTAVGVIRVDGIGKPETEASNYLDPALHALGLGRGLLAAGAAILSTCNMRPRRLVATVRATNAVSR